MKVRATIHILGLAPGDITEVDDDVAAPLVKSGFLVRLNKRKDPEPVETMAAVVRTERTEERERAVEDEAKSEDKPKTRARGAAQDRSQG